MHNIKSTRQAIECLSDILQLSNHSFQSHRKLRSRSLSSLERQNESFQNHIYDVKSYTWIIHSIALCVQPSVYLRQANALAHPLVEHTKLLPSHYSPSVCVWRINFIAHTHMCICLYASKFQWDFARNETCKHILLRDQTFITVKWRASSYRTGEGDFSHCIWSGNRLDRRQ